MHGSAGRRARDQPERGAAGARRPREHGPRRLRARLDRAARQVPGPARLRRAGRRRAPPSSSRRRGCSRAAWTPSSSRPSPTPWRCSWRCEAIRALTDLPIVAAGGVHRRRRDVLRARARGRGRARCASCPSRRSAPTARSARARSTTSSSRCCRRPGGLPRRHPAQRRPAEPRGRAPHLSVVARATWRTTRRGWSRPARAWSADAAARRPSTSAPCARRSTACAPGRTAARVGRCGARGRRPPDVPSLATTAAPTAAAAQARRRGVPRDGRARSAARPQHREARAGRQAPEGARRRDRRHQRRLARARAHVRPADRHPGARGDRPRHQHALHLSGPEPHGHPGRSARRARDGHPEHPGHDRRSAAHRRLRQRHGGLRRGRDRPHPRSSPA